jgi:ubiquinone/menaquinone biosynthesis C-methylase UbiE
MDNTDNEVHVSDAFSRQSIVFDEIDKASSSIVWMRERVRKEVLSYIQPGSRMLELNCGTGIDSIYFAQQGYDVMATDNADGMLAQLNEKITNLGIGNNIFSKKCSFNHLETLDEGKFDYVFSNFGGLNCTDKLYEVISGIDKVLKPGGYFTLVIMPKVCPWEMLTVLKGYFRTAFRRFKKNGTKAHLEGLNFYCYYYSPQYVIKHAGKGYVTESIKGLCVTVPPPFIENFFEKHPRSFRLLEKIENKIWDKTPFNRWADHYIITMKKIS